MRYRLPLKHNPDDHGPGGLLRRGNGNGWTDVHGPAVEEHDVSDTQANTRSWPESLRQALEDLRAIPHLGVWAGLGAAMAIGLWVRLTFILANDFPLNDGGMFYTMALDIQRAGFALPEFTTYNLNGIPFAYPPLGLYVAAIVEAVTPLDMLGVTRFLPLLFNVLTIGAVYFLARAMLVSTAAATVAAIAFALLPRSYTWLIVGGGLTRSPALLFAVLGTLFVYLFYTRRQWKFMAPAAVLPGLAMLTHPEVGWFTIFTYVLFFLLHGLHKEGLLGSALAAAGTLAITAPWWGTVIARHGMEPLLAAAGTGNHELAIQMVRQIGYLYFTEEPYGRILAVLGVLGGFAAIARGYFTLPLWFLLIFIMEPRSAYTYVTVPLAMSISLIVTTVMVPGLRRAHWTNGGPPVPAGASEGRLSLRQSTRLWAPIAAAALLLTFVGAYAGVSAVNANEHILKAVSPGDRAAMEWVTANTPPESTFLVMSYSHWANDQAGEWFPALTGRHSVATVQGSEWLSGGMFEWRQSRFYHLVSCAYRDLGCIKGWEQLAAEPYDYIYLSTGCCGGDLINGLQASPEHELVYGTAAVGIWRYAPALPEEADTGDAQSRSSESPWRPRIP